MHLHKYLFELGKELRECLELCACQNDFGPAEMCSEHFYQVLTSTKPLIHTFMVCLTLSFFVLFSHIPACCRTPRSLRCASASYCTRCLTLVSRQQKPALFPAFCGYMLNSFPVAWMFPIKSAIIDVGEICRIRGVAPLWKSTSNNGSCLLCSWIKISLNVQNS